MKTLIKQNYDSIVKRGLINNSTTLFEFIDKLYEEVSEFEESLEFDNMDNFKEELADIILVCFNIAQHYKIDIESELKKKIEINYSRV
jgi:NTP pyrophosphatase (non-canonical NTP hydrolase)